MIFKIKEKEISSSSLSSQLQKNIASRVYKPILPAFPKGSLSGVEGPLHLPFLSRCLRIRQCGCSLVFFACSSIVVSRSSLPPQTPRKYSFRLRSSKTRAHSTSLIIYFSLHFRSRSHSRSVNWGVTAACVYARLLNRSGCGLVTVFEKSTGSAVWLRTSTKPHFYPYFYLQSFESRVFILSTPFFRFVHFIHLDPIFLRSSKTCAKPLCILHRSPSFPSRVPLWAFTFAPLADVSRATFILIPYLHSVSFRTPTLHCAISQPSWLHFVFPAHLL